MKRLLKTFSIFDLIIISIMAALGIATKSIIVPLIHIITGPLFIPGGALAGGFYMLWLVMGGAIVRKPGAATLAAIVQAILMIVLSVYGTHGIISLFTYSLPGIIVDIILMIRSKYELADCFFACIGANITGTFLSNLVFFRLPLVPLMFSFSLAALSGGLGGMIAYMVITNIRKYKVIES